MYGVSIIFKNGSKIHFYANAFDFDPKQLSPPSIIHRFEYTDMNGQASHVHIVPVEVACIVVTPNTDSGQPTATWS